jgi:hypothetical protein
MALQVTPVNRLPTQWIITSAGNSARVFNEQFGHFIAASQVVQQCYIRWHNRVLSCRKKTESSYGNQNGRYFDVTKANEFSTRWRWSPLNTVVWFPAGEDHLKWKMAAQR